jgi:methylmalonyl-CoA mutase
VLPFDALGGGDGHGRRLARNTQTILAEEANLFRVADPGAGSGAIEAMTAELAEAAWKRFQAIEAVGGIVAAIGNGTLLREIAAAREARIAGVVAREITMVGVNAFTGSDEPDATLPRRMPVRQTERLIFQRLAEAFE